MPSIARLMRLRCLAAAVLFSVTCTMTGTSAHADWSRAVGSEIDLGLNLVGEACRAVLERHDKDYDFAKHRIFCGAWSEPSGTVNSWTFKRNRTNSAWRDRKKYWWRPDIDYRYDCEPGADSEILDGVHVATLDCVTRQGGFPYAAYVGKIRQRIFFTDFIPANANVVATLSGIVSDEIEANEIEKGSISRIVAGLKSRATSEPSLLYGANDFAGYKENFRLGRFLNHSKEHASAVAAFQRALEYQQRLLGPDHSATGATIARIGNDLRNQNLTEEAYSYFDRAEALLNRSPNKSDLAELMVYRSYDANKLGNHEAAISYASRAIELRKEYWDSDNDYVAHAIYAKSYAEFTAGRIDDAESSAEEALRLYERAVGLVHHWPANVRLLLSQIEADNGDFEAALNYATDAIGIRERLFGRGIAYAQALWQRAEIHAKNEDQTSANIDFVAGVRSLANLGLADQLSNDSIDATLLAAAISGRVSASNTIDLPPDLREALFTAVQLPSRNISRRIISRMAARSAADTPKLQSMTRDLQDLKTKRDDLRYDLARRMGREEKRRNPEREATIQKQIGELTNKISSTSLALQNDFPAYARLAAPAPLSTQESSALLREGEALVRFVLGETHGAAIMLKNGQTSVHLIDVPSDAIGETVARLRVGLESGGAERFDTVGAHKLFETIFGPLGKEIADVSHLLVVPEGPLASLPPAILVTAPPKGNRANYAEIAWLGRDRVISILPTIKSLRDLRVIAGQSDGAYPFIGFADPDYAHNLSHKSQTHQLGCPEDSTPFDPHKLGALARLPETAREVDAINTSVRGKPEHLFIGRKANEASIFGLDLSQYRGIAFATHGLLPSETGCAGEPGLALAPGNSLSPATDGLLTASEISTLRLDADWVLLSACNTGTLETGFRGDSLSALTNSFFHAGTRLVLATHWAIASEPTVQLTTDALSKLSDLGAADALRQAQLRFLSNPRLSHPAFWAPFTIYGDGAKR